MLEGAAGRVAAEGLLPPHLRDPKREWTIPQMREVLTQLAIGDPKKYPEVVQGLLELGRTGASLSTGFNFGLDDLSPTQAYNRYVKEVQKLANQYMAQKGDMTEQDQEFASKLPELNAKYFAELENELKEKGNPVYTVVKTKIRGNPTTLKRFFLGDGVYADPWNRFIPYPIENNFSKGMSPAEYWASLYGSKQGIVTTKLAPADAGFIYKQLAQLAHRLLVIKRRGPRVGYMRGMPVPTDDSDNIGAVLAQSVGGYPEGTVITRKVLDRLLSKNIKNILVRSPIAGGPPDGVYAEDVGAREGHFPALGTLVGLEAAQAFGERVSQSSVGKKHQGMLAGYNVRPAEIISQLINVPKKYSGGAAHAETDGRITKIMESPAGGYYIHVNDVPHYVPANVDILVKKGDIVEAGDILSGGMPNPAKITEKKGIGEGRKYFTDLFVKTFRDIGLTAHRRNAELIARGLIDYVQFDKPYRDYLPGEIVSYSALEHLWTPRKDSEYVSPSRAQDMFLETPVLHYTIGTRITPSVIKTLQDYKIDKIRVHREPPPLSPVMLRAMDVVRYDPDFFAKLFGSYQKRSLQEAAAYTGQSTLYNTTSFVPSLAEGLYFGKKWPQEVLKRK